MATKHTPGKWIANHDGYGLWIGTEDKMRVIADVKDEKSLTIGNNRIPQPDEIHANARLIAAAPELLEACQMIAKWLKSEDLAPNRREVVEAAIERATKTA